MPIPNQMTYASCKTISLAWMKYSNGRAALRALDPLTGEPLATLSVNLPDEHLPKNCMYVKDYAENEGALKTLVDAGIVRDTGHRVTRGHVSIPLVEILVVCTD